MVCGLGYQGEVTDQTLAITVQCEITRDLDLTVPGACPGALLNAPRELLPVVHPGKQKNPGTTEDGNSPGPIVCKTNNEPFILTSIWRNSAKDSVYTTSILPPECRAYRS